MSSLARYHQELVALLGDSPAPLYIVGQCDPQLQALLADVSTNACTDARTHVYADIDRCLEADVMPSASILLMIRADAVDTLATGLGIICQRFPNQVLIELQHDANDKSSAQACRDACFAMGFRQALNSVSDGLEYQLYEYRLKNYKRVPDWLNSRFWANPERFNIR